MTDFPLVNNSFFKRVFGISKSILPIKIAPSNLDSSKGSSLVLGEEQDFCMSDSLLNLIWVTRIVGSS